MEEMLWDFIHFYSSLWASCTAPFGGIPLNITLLIWLLVYNLKGVDNF